MVIAEFTRENILKVDSHLLELLSESFQSLNLVPNLLR